MTNNILDVLSYMFDYLFESSTKNDGNEIDNDALKEHLSEAGFDAIRIDKALNWLENIASLQDTEIENISGHVSNGMRIYSTEEKIKLNTKSRGFLLFMENIGQLNTTQREAIISQVMSLNESNLSLDDLKWVTMMVLNNSIEEDSASQWLESIVFTDDKNTLQ